MGREALCVCRCNDAAFRVKALIEPPNLLLRGQLRRSLPLAQLKAIRVDAENLHFTFEEETFLLSLGRETATRWAAAFTIPPPTLAKKLGITPDSTVRVIGSSDDEALRQALSSARSIDDQNPDLIVACVNTPAELGVALRTAAKQLAARIPIWLIYPKGKGHALCENDVRSAGLAAGIVDTKVASVSTALTALRFVRRRDG